MTQEFTRKSWLSPLREIDPEATLQEILMIYDAIKGWDGDPQSLVETAVANGYGWMPISLLDKVSRSINHMHFRIKTQKPDLKLPLPERCYWVGKGNRRYHLYQNCTAFRLHDIKPEGPYNGREVETFLDNKAPHLCNECNYRLTKQSEGSVFGRSESH